MTINQAIPFPPLGKIKIRVDRVYGNITLYPVCERAKLIAAIAGTKTLTPGTLGLAQRLGFEVVASPASILTASDFVDQVVKP